MRTNIQHFSSVLWHRKTWNNGAFGRIWVRGTAERHRCIESTLELFFISQLYICFQVLKVNSNASRSTSLIRKCPQGQRRAVGMAIGRSKRNYESVFGQCGVGSRHGQSWNETKCRRALKQVTYARKQRWSVEGGLRLRGEAWQKRTRVNSNSDFFLSPFLSRSLGGREALPSFF